MSGEMHILIADDHALIRKGLRQVIEAETDFKVIGEAANGEEALALILERQPQMAILDVNMPKLNGFEVAREVSRRHLDVAIIFLTMYKDKAFFDRGMEVGAIGYVLKDCALDEIVQALKTIARGRRFISSDLFDHLHERRAGSLAPQVHGLSELTATERRVLKLIAEYKTSKEIAAELHIHYRTVDNHRTNICNKLGLQGSHSLLKFAVEHQSELQ